ncbi:M48 family metalloprotease [Oceanospirillum sanctuarii]|uniref:M48 family metalloprotease n=1 Tax=Oceanospirillum sanctuarii TaxID=1434821 RepID=UPI001C3D5BEC|nr:M48 family metalloprotease [Oceanospirillum sanctuarii]
MPRKTQHQLKAFGHQCKKSVQAAGLSFGLLLTGSALTASALYSPQLLAETNQNKLPSIGSDQPDRITTNREYTLGRAWLRQYRASSPIIYDPILQSYLEGLVDKLAVEAELYERRLNLVAINAKTINAFAVPGGVMGVHSALLLKAEDEDMVASVLAHELAHLSQRHYARRKDNAEGQSLPLLTAMLTGLVLSANGHTQAGVAAIASSQAAAIQNQLQFSRLHEQEADAVGFQVLTDAGFDSSGMARMFELLQAEARTNGGNAPEFLLTHPLTQSRIAFAKERERDTDLQTFYSNLEFQLIRVRALLHQTQVKDRPVALTALLKSVPDSMKEPVKLYADILDALDQGKPDNARQLAEQLALQPDHLYFRLLTAKVLVAIGQSDQAFALLDAQLKETPDKMAVKAFIAQTYLNAGKTAEAVEAFKALSKERPEDPWVWQQLAKAATDAKDLLTVYKANAEFHQLTGDIPHGVKELKLAREYASNDPIEFARIDHRIKDLETLFKELDFNK